MTGPPPLQRPLIAEGLFSYKIGGSERVGADLALEFKRRGYDVLCFAFYGSEGPIRGQLEEAGVRCLDLNYEKFRGPTKRVAYQWAMARMLRREKVSALHVHHATALILCGIPARLTGTRRVVMTEHGLHQLKDRPKYRRSAERYCRFADEITAVEHAQVDYFRDELHVPASKLHYVANGVRIAQQSAELRGRMRTSLGIGAGEFVFLYVGRLNPVKDLKTLLRAFAPLAQDSRIDARLVIAGDGEERAALEALAGELGIADAVKFLGARTDVYDVLSIADTFTMSSLTEGLPMALLEAMAAGVPCVATAVGGIPRLLGEGRGRVAPPASPQELSNAMREMASSPELRAATKRNALAHVQTHFSLEAVTDRYLELLDLPRQWT